jgi:hypothetical protein
MSLIALFKNGKWAKTKRYDITQQIFFPLHDVLSHNDNACKYYKRPEVGRTEGSCNERIISCYGKYIEFFLLSFPFLLVAVMF